MNERIVRNGDLFFSLLIDKENGTLRMVDFFGGNHRRKEQYLQRLRHTEGIRKVFALVESSEVSGWRNVGFQREGIVPSYFKRTDAHVMSKLFESDFHDSSEGSDMERRAAILAKATDEGEELAAMGAGPTKCAAIDRAEAFASVRSELARLRKVRNNKPPPERDPVYGAAALFGQFGRNVDRYYWLAKHRRTSQCNVFGAEYQECFGNAKVSMYFTPKTRAERTLACKGLGDFLRWLTEIGAVTAFALTNEDDPVQNQIFVAAGFQNGGWLRHHMRKSDVLLDQLLWTNRMSSP